MFYFYPKQRIVSFTQYVRNLIPLWAPLQDAVEDRTDADVADVVQEHLHHTARQMCQPGNRHKLAELIEEEKKTGT